MTVRIEVESILAAYAATKNLPVAYENVEFSQPEDGGWLELHFIADDSVVRGLDASGRTDIGMFQISIYVPQGEGMGAVSALAREIANLYPMVPKVGLTSIEAPAKISTGIIVDQYVCVPVTLRYRAEF